MCAHPMIAGDLRRLEADSRDAQHLAALAVFAGITPAQAKIVMDAFFDYRNPTPDEFRQIVATLSPTTVGHPEAKPVGEGGVQEGLGKGIGDVGDPSGLQRGG